MNHDHLEDWAYRVAQVLQDFCDEAQEAVGNPDGEDQLLDVRAMLLELDRIARGLPPWQAILGSDESTSGLDAL